MKKFLCFALCVVMFLSCASCKKKEKAPQDLTVQLVDRSDTVSEIATPVELEWYRYPFQDPAVPKTITVEFCGETITGEYFQSRVARPNYYQTNEYRSRDNNNLFSVDAAGRVISYFWFDDAPGTGLTPSQEECLEIAEKFLSEEIGIDLSRFAVETTVRQDLTGTYTFCFTKRIGELETAEQARVMVKADGTLYAFSSFMLGKIPDEIPAFDFSDLTQRVNERVNEMCASVIEKYEKVEHTEPHYCLTMQNEKEFALTCSLKVVCTKYFEDADAYREDTELLEFLILP